MGKIDSIANPISGQNSWGSKIMDKLGLFPEENASPNPLPSMAYTNVPGMIPIKVPKIKTDFLIFKIPGTKFTIGNGKRGTSRRNKRY